MKRSRWSRETTIFVSIVVVASIIAFGAFSSAGSDDVGGIVVPHVVVTGSTASPIFEAINSGKGPGLEGVSKKGTGVVGVTKFESKNANNGGAGVQGVDASNFGLFNTGVLGTSTNRVGVTGVSVNGIGMSGTSNTDNGVDGFSTGGDGVSGTSTSGNGVSGTTTSGAGIFGFSTLGNGIVGEVTNENVSNFSGVLGEDMSTGNVYDNGVHGVSNIGIGVLAEANAGIPLEVRSDVQPGYEVAMIDSQGFVVLYIESSGNIHTSGEIYTNGPCNAGCIGPRGGGRRVQSYESQASSPTIEDFGQGRLVDGKAYVHVDAKFANVIDRTANYLVFITPEGDSRGLYVDQKTSVGFSVHENQGGRSTLNFTYRIAARPYGSKETRLPMVELMKGTTRLRIPPHSDIPASRPHR